MIKETLESRLTVPPPATCCGVLDAFQDLMVLIEFLRLQNVQHERFVSIQIIAKRRILKIMNTFATAPSPAALTEATASSPAALTEASTG
jgi:hypothetical protein